MLIRIRVAAHRDWRRRERVVGGEEQRRRALRAARGQIGVEVVVRDDRVDARVLLAERRRRDRAVRVAGDADVLGVDALPVRVVGRRAGSVRLEILRIRVRRVRQDEVEPRADGVLVDARGARRALERRGAVGLVSAELAVALALRIDDHHHITRLGHLLGEPRVHLVVGLEPGREHEHGIGLRLVVRCEQPRAQLRADAVDEVELRMPPAAGRRPLLGAAERIGDLRLRNGAGAARARGRSARRPTRARSRSRTRSARSRPARCTSPGTPGSHPRR